MVKLIKDITKGAVQSAYVCAPFDEAKAHLEKYGYELITPEQFAQARIAQGASNSVSVNGAYTSMGDVMIPKKGRFLTKLSLVMERPVEATEAHRNGNEFYVSNEDVERVLASGNVFVPYNQSGIPFNKFAEDPITSFVFGKTAEKYGLFLKEALKETGIIAMPLRLEDKGYIDSKENPFANQAWLRRLVGDCRSVLNGNGRVLHCNYAVRGVRHVEPRSGETVSRIHTPNLREILRYSRRFVPEVARKEFEKGLGDFF